MASNVDVLPNAPLLATPWVGQVLTVLSGISFLVLCMVLPLVGKAGAQVPYARQNHMTFLTILLAALVLAVLATISKLQRRRIDGSPRPYLSFTLCGLCVLLLTALSTGLLHR